MLISVTIGYAMGRQATKDRQRIKDSKPLESVKLPDIPKIPRKIKEPENDPIYEGIMNILSYEGENQHEER